MSFGTPTGGGNVVSSTVIAASYVSTVSKQPPDNSVVLFGINLYSSSGIPVTPTIVAPWGWADATLVASVNDGLNRSLTVLKATGTAATSSTFTVTGATTAFSGCIAHAAWITGANTTAPVVQSTSRTVASSSHPSVTLPGTPSSNSAVFGYFAEVNTFTMTPGSGFTQDSQIASANSANCPRFMNQYLLSTGTTTVDCTSTTATQYLMIGLELALASTASVAKLPGLVNGGLVRPQLVGGGLVR